MAATDELISMIVEVLAVLGFIGLSLLGLVLVRRRVPLANLREHHDIASAWFAVVGGLYGIVLAFVLVSSWQRFEEARERSEVEANALADLHKHSHGLSEPGRSALAHQTVAYARAAIDREWPMMRRGRSSPETREIYHAICDTVLGLEAVDGKQVALFQNTISKMDDFSDGRRGRLLYARVGLPGIVWLFLIGTGVVTIAFSYFFGHKVLLSQALMTVALAGTIAVTLVLIHEMQTPFSGSVRVPPYGFRQFLHNLNLEEDPDR